MANPKVISYLIGGCLQGQGLLLEHSDNTLAGLGERGQRSDDVAHHEGPDFGSADVYLHFPAHLLEVGHAVDDLHGQAHRVVVEPAGVVALDGELEGGLAALGHLSDEDGELGGLAPRDGRAVLRLLAGVLIVVGHDLLGLEAHPDFGGVVGVLQVVLEGGDVPRRPVGHLLQLGEKAIHGAHPARSPALGQDFGHPLLAVLAHGARGDPVAASDLRVGSAVVLDVLEDGGPPRMGVDDGGLRGAQVARGGAHRVSLTRSMSLDRTKRVIFRSQEASWAPVVSIPKWRARSVSFASARGTSTPM